MTASAVASSTESSTRSPLENFTKPTRSTSDNFNYPGFDSDININNWKRPYPPDLMPSLQAHDTEPMKALDSGQAVSQTTSTASSSTPLRLLNPRSQPPYFSMFFLRSNNPAPQLSGTDIGPIFGNNAPRLSSSVGSGILASAQTTLVSSSSATIQRSAVAAGSPIEMSSPSGAPAGAETTTISMHATTNKTATTTETILSTSKRPVIIIYPTVSPESIVVPIVSCIFGFPLFALLVICCLRRRAKLARERDRRRNYDMQDHAVSLVRFSPIHRLNNRSSRAISLRPERSLSRGFPSLELDTVIEERSDPEQTQTDLLSPESPLDPQKFRDFHSS